MTEIHNLLELPIEPKWFTLPIKAVKGCKFKIAPLNNEAHKRKYAMIIESLGGLPDSIEEREHALADSLAGTVLLDWEGFTSNGEAVPFSEDVANTLFDNCPSILEAVIVKSKNLSLQANISCEKTADTLKKP